MVNYFLVIKDVFNNPYLIPLGVLEIIVMVFYIYKFKPNWLYKIINKLFS